MLLGGSEEGSAEETCLALESEPGCEGAVAAQCPEPMEPGRVRAVATLGWMLLPPFAKNATRGAPQPHLGAWVTLQVAWKHCPKNISERAHEM